MENATPPTPKGRVSVAKITMNEQLQRFLVGFGFAFCAGALIYVGEPVWSLLPAVAAVYVAGSLLWDVYKEKK